MAKKILKHNLNVQPGEVIQITGGEYKSDMLKAFFKAAIKLNAVPVFRMTTDETMKAFYGNLSEENLAYWDKYFKHVTDYTDYWIFMNQTKDPKALFKDFTDEQNKLRKKQGGDFNKAFMASGIKACRVFDMNPNYSTYEETRNESYEKMYWKAIKTDYKDISKKAQKLKELLEKSEKIELSTTRGTKISFSVKDRGIMIRDGIFDDPDKADKYSESVVNLPTGFIRAGINEMTANGKVLVPTDYSSATKSIIENISFKVKKGKLSKMKGGEGFDEYYKDFSGLGEGFDMIGYLHIGLNPEFKIDGDKIDFNNFYGAGAVSLAFGLNTYFGGKNKDAKNSWLFLFSDATLSVDGKIIIKEGKLLLE
jgi:leucyl aminopeptidase (aminopeptidase T)